MKVFELIKEGTMEKLKKFAWSLLRNVIGTLVVTTLVAYPLVMWVLPRHRYSSWIFRTHDGIFFVMHWIVYKRLLSRNTEQEDYFTGRSFRKGLFYFWTIVALGYSLYPIGHMLEARINPFGIVRSTATNSEIYCIMLARTAVAYINLELGTLLLKRTYYYRSKLAVYGTMYGGLLLWYIMVIRWYLI